MAEQESRDAEQAGAGEEKRPGLIRRWHRMHVKAAKRMANVDGAVRIGRMVKQLAKGASIERCPRCGVGEMPSWSNKDEVCPECGFVRPVAVTEENIETLRHQLDEIDDVEIQAIQATHKSLNHTHLTVAILSLIVALSLIIYGKVFYTVIVLILSITQVMLGLKHAYYHWIVQNQRLYVVNNVRDWMQSGCYWVVGK